MWYITTNMFSLGVMLGVYTAGISGAHLNPAGMSICSLSKATY